MTVGHVRKKRTWVMEKKGEGSNDLLVADNIDRSRSAVNYDKF